MKSADEIRTRIAQLRAAADALEWAVETDGHKLMSSTSAASPAEGLPAVGIDVASALFNLGVGSKAKAEDATKKAIAANGTATDFESLFRAALKVLRP